MNGWENFFIAEVGASAALAGLVFVGVSINLAKIMTVGGLSEIALEALVLLLGVLVISSLLLIPGQALAVAGIEILGCGLAIWAIIAIILIQYLRHLDPKDRRYIPQRVVLAQAASLPFIFAGIVALVQGATGLYWLVAAVILAFLIAFMDAWVLLVEINR